jgi:signal transduction histidine kinase
LRIHPFNINFLKGIFTAFFVFATVFPLKYYFFSDFNYLFNLFLTSFIVLILFFLFLFILKFEEEDRFIFKKIKERLKL